MSKSIYRRGIVICAVAVIGLALMMFVEPVLAQDFGLKDAAKGTGLSTSRTIPTIVGGFIQQALSLIGVIFLLLMLYAGFLWMTARGNEQTVEKAKNLISGAVIGIIIVASAYAITSFVIGGLTGTNSSSSSSSSSTSTTTGTKDAGEECVTGAECKSGTCSDLPGSCSHDASEFCNFDADCAPAGTCVGAKRTCDF